MCTYSPRRSVVGGQEEIGRSRLVSGLRRGGERCSSIIRCTAPAEHTLEHSTSSNPGRQGPSARVARQRLNAESARAIDRGHSRPRLASVPAGLIREPGPAQEGPDCRGARASYRTGGPGPLQPGPPGPGTPLVDESGGGLGHHENQGRSGRVRGAGLGLARALPPPAWSAPGAVRPALDEEDQPHPVLFDSTRFSRGPRNSRRTGDRGTRHRDRPGPAARRRSPAACRRWPSPKIATEPMRCEHDLRQRRVSSLVAMTAEGVPDIARAPRSWPEQWTAGSGHGHPRSSPRQPVTTRCHDHRWSAWTSRRDAHDGRH